MPVNPLTPNTPNPLVPGNLFTPVGQCGIDPSSGLAFAEGMCNYTVISTIGTTTVKSSPGLFLGFNAISTGTAVMTAIAYDIVGTSTIQLHPSTAPAALGVFGQPAGAGMALRFAGSLVVITTGTAGTYNTLWD